MCADDLFVKVVLLECDYVSQPAKSLPPEQVQEIFAIFCNLEMMAHRLGDDVERGSGELSVNSGDQYLRRTLVRIVAAHVEGYSFVLKQIVLRLRVPLQAQLSFEELSKLEEVKLDTTGQPVLDEHGSPRRRFLPLLDNSSSPTPCSGGCVAARMSCRMVRATKPFGNRCWSVTE